MSEIDDAVAKLKKKCDEAHEDAQAKTSCSHAVWYVLKALVNESEPYRNANELVDYLTKNWSEVELDFGYRLANQGRVVIGGKKEPSNGHVIVIYQGDKILNGGYQYYWAKGKKYLTLPGKTYYPRCLSTSKGSWPGAKSKGDKTVWDPWGKDEKFQEVLFWAKPPLG